MTQYWEPGNNYGHGDVVEYNGHKYKIIQPHASQSDWTPDNTPALWGRLDDHDQGYGGQQQQNQGYGQQQHNQGYGGQQQQQPHNPAYQPPAEHYNPPPSDQKVDIKHEEQKKNWWDLDDDRKKQLEIGGGLAVGAGLLAAGFAAYRHHEKSEDDKKAQLWSLQNWARDAQARRNQYNQSGLTAPAMWIYNEGTNIPHNAISTGQEHDWTLYVSRAPLDGGIQIGKASNVFQKGAVIGYRHEEIQLPQYEILVGNMNGLRWIGASGRFSAGSLGGHRPVEGGRENDGTPLYIARAPHKGAVHPGKASEQLDGAFIPYGGKEVCVEQYEVLCYA